MMGQTKGKKTYYWWDKVLYPIRYGRKIYYENPTAYQKFRIATYTKEIGILQRVTGLLIK